MSIKRITVGESNSTGNNLTNRDSLEVTFTPTGYPLTASSVTNCTVTPTSISATTNIFTATFPNEETGAYSFVLSNTVPEVPHGILSNIPNTNINAIGPQWGLLRETVGGVSYEKVNSSTSLPWNSSGGLPYVTNTGGSYANTGISNTAQVQRTGSNTLKFDSSVFIPSFVSSAKVVINIIAYSASFNLVQGEYVRTTRLGGSDNNSRAWMYNTTTDTYTEMTTDSSVTHANAVKAPADGTYIVVVASGVYAFGSQTGTRTGTSTWGDFIAHSTTGSKKSTITISGTVGPSPAELIGSSLVQEVGDNLIHLFELTLPAPYLSTLYFHDGLNDNKNIYFANKEGSALNEYIAMPIAIDGIETKVGGGSNRPTLNMANIPVIGRTIANNSDGINDEINIEQVLSDQGLASVQDFLYSTLVYRCTLLKYTKLATDTPMLPIEYPSHTYTVDRVSNEMSAIVQFELATPADLDRVTLPNRRVVGRYCSWEYQGALYNRGGCTVPKNSFGMFFDEDDKLITANITGSNAPAVWNNGSSYSSGARVRRLLNGQWRIFEAVRAVPANKEPNDNPYYWKRIDVCGKRIRSCKLRFHGIQSTMSSNESTLIGTIPDSTYLETSKSLPFGGFPGSKKFK